MTVSPATDAAACAQSQSPFAACLARVRDQLPGVFQEQFLNGPDSDSLVRLDGTMDRVWHRPALLTPCFRLLSRWDMLFAETGQAIPARMVILPTVGPDNRYGHRWKRTFSFATPRSFDAVMLYDRVRNCVVERMGPAHAIELAWDIDFIPPSVVRIRAVGCCLAVGRYRLALPRYCYPSVEAVETANVAGENTLHINLIVAHPLLGPVFGYEGTFTLRRIPRTAAV